MSRRWRPPHPAREIRPAACPNGRRYRTQALARDAAVSTAVHSYTLAPDKPTPCTLCGGWHLVNPEAA